MIELRPYQSDLISRLRSSMREHRRVLTVAPCGAGKTVCFAHTAAGCARAGKRVLIVVHRVELLAQASDKLTASGVPHGLIARDAPLTDELVQVAMVQTLARRLDRVHAPDFIVIDEAHHSVSATWSRVTEHFKGARVLGFSATPAL